MKTILVSIIVFIFISLYYDLSCQELNIKTNPVSPDTTIIKKQVRIRMVTRNAPDVTFELSGMYDYGVYELSGNDNGDLNPEQFVKGENFGVRHGLGTMMTAKIPLHKKGNLRADISLAYNRFSSNYNKPMMDVTGYDFVKYNVYSAIAGIENNFTPKYRIKTFVGIGVIASVISGDAQITDSTGTGMLTIKPGFRLGISINSGLEYMISNSLGFNCGIRFTHANIWLKQSKTSDNPEEINLNDKKVSPWIPYSGFKQFAWGSFFAGFNYYFGIQETEYTFPRR